MDNDLQTPAVALFPDLGDVLDLGLDARVLAAVEDLGYTRPSPIQEATIPLLLDGRDVGVTLGDVELDRQEGIGVLLCEVADRVEMDGARLHASLGALAQA